MVSYPFMNAILKPEISGWIYENELECVFMKSSQIICVKWLSKGIHWCMMYINYPVSLQLFNQ